MNIIIDDLNELYKKLESIKEIKVDSINWIMKRQERSGLKNILTLNIMEEEYLSYA